MQHVLLCSKISCGLQSNCIKLHLNYIIYIITFPFQTFSLNNDNLFNQIGGRKADDIVAWLEKSLGPVVTDLKSAADIKEFTGKADVVVVGYFTSNETDEAKAYIAAADSGIEGLNFGICINADVTKEAEASVNTVVLYKKVSFERGKRKFERGTWDLA